MFKRECAAYCYVVLWVDHSGHLGK